MKTTRTGGLHRKLGKGKKIVPTKTLSMMAYVNLGGQKTGKMP